jgi:hypothetical protein
MNSSNAPNHDAAIHQLLDLMRIPGENRTAAASELLQLIRRYQRLSEYDPVRQKKRSQRVSKLLDTLRRELKGQPPIELLEPELKRCEHVWTLPPSKHSDALSRRWATIMPSTRIKRPSNRPPGSIENIRLHWLMVDLYEMQKCHGGKLLTLTNNQVLDTITGTLPAALKILHRFVPSIVPSSIPYQTLYRYRRMSLDELEIRTKGRR